MKIKQIKLLTMILLVIPIIYAKDMILDCDDFEISSKEKFYCKAKQGESCLFKVEIKVKDNKSRSQIKITNEFSTDVNFVEMKLNEEDLLFHKFPRTICSLNPQIINGLLIDYKFKKNNKITMGFYSNESGKFNTIISYYGDDNKLRQLTLDPYYILDENYVEEENKNNENINKNINGGSKILDSGRIIEDEKIVNENKDKEKNNSNKIYYLISLLSMMIIGIIIYNIYKNDEVKR